MSNDEMIIIPKDIIGEMSEWAMKTLVDIEDPDEMIIAHFHYWAAITKLKELLGCK